MREPINHQRRWRFTFLVAIAAVELLAPPFAAGQFSDPAADLNALPKGNSKGLNKPDRYAPRVFRELWGLPTPAGAKDLPESSGVPSASPGAAKSAEHEAAWPQGDGFLFDLRDDRLIIAYSGQPVAHYVFRDPKILRPYFAHLHAPNGIQVTRNHPPIPGRDATDHDTMHAGVWLGFGDINGVDFWRNKGRVEHARFSELPNAKIDRLTFATVSRLLTPGGKELCIVTNRCAFARRRGAWLLTWEASFAPNEVDIVFGDQEEMGFGARVATAIAEKNGGTVRNSEGQTTAVKTWGQPAEWCDYSGEINGRRAGLTLMAHPGNFRKCWWHNRDYGVFVANPFGRKALKQGGKSAVEVKRGESLRLRFAAVIYGDRAVGPATAYADYVAMATE